MSSDGEKQGVRERIEKMTEHVQKHSPGMSGEKAREIARRAALNHEHNQGRRDPNRNR
jgi:hypothetical protein